MKRSIKNYLTMGLFGMGLFGITQPVTAGPDENQRYQIWQAIKAKQKARQEAAQVAESAPCGHAANKAGSERAHDPQATN